MSRLTVLAAVPRAALGAAGGQLTARATVDPGVNLVGYGGLVNGVGEASDLVGQLLREAQVAVRDFPYRLSGGTGPAAAAPVGRALYPVSIAALNCADHMVGSGVYPRVFSPRRHRIGVWHWEVDVVPRWHRLARLVTDQVWTTSEYQREIMMAAFGLPVEVLPLPVELPAANEQAVAEIRARLPHPEAFLFGFQFDWNSSRKRKNPDGVLEAYLRAFPQPRADVGLLLKTINGHTHTAALGQLRQRCAERPDIIVIDEFWPREVNACLSRALDCYVSLHRAEGFGLTIAKAMAAGKPVIATGFSGNVDFMPAGTALLVPWQRVQVGPDLVYPAEATWADPDLDVAADMLRSVVGEAGMRERLGVAAREHIAASRSRQRAVEWVRAQLLETRPGNSSTVRPRR